MFTFFIILVTVYVTNRITRLYCYFKLRNDVRLISDVIKNQEIDVSIKDGVLND